MGRQFVGISVLNIMPQSNGAASVVQPGFFYSKGCGTFNTAFVNLFLVVCSRLKVFEPHPAFSASDYH